MHPVDKQKRDLRLAAARAEIEQAMRRPPFDLGSAGATRVAAYKKAMLAARQLMERGSTAPVKLEDAARAIKASGGDDMSAIAAAAYKGKR